MSSSHTSRRHPSSVLPSTSELTAPHAPALTARFMSCVRTFTSIEYSGFYSLEKLYAFQINQQRAFWRAQAQLWEAALPTFLIVIGIELLPLQDPSLPWTQNLSFFVRTFARAWVVAMNVNIQAQEVIPELQRPPLHYALLSVLLSLPYVGTVLAIAAIYDVFPVPFSTLAPIIPTAVLGLLTRYLSVRGLVNQDPVLRPQIIRFEKLVHFVFALVVVYSLYGFAFRRVDATVQVALSFALYGIKQAAKYRLWHLSHVHDHHDMTGENVACGVHLFHALFTTMCVQTARSNETLVVLLGLGVLQDGLALRHLHRQSCEVDSIMRELERDGLLREGNSPFLAKWTAQLISEAQPSTPTEARAETFRGVPIMLTRAAYFRHHLTAAQSLQAIQSEQVDSLVPFQPAFAASRSPTVIHRKAQATQAVAHLLHCREVVLLRMFIDLFVPLFYLAFCVVMLLLPNQNRHYFDSLSGLDWVSLRTLHGQVSILVVVKLVAIATVCRLFHVHGQPSGVHQLVFVMSSQHRTMQAWFLINFQLIIDFSLAHNGNDLSFQFKWIHHKP